MTPVRTTIFNGEKTPYELGEVQNVLPDFNSLRLRSHEADLKSDVVKIISNKFFKWVIGSGLKLESEPVLSVLKTENITAADLSGFQETVEARFNLWARSKRSDYKGQLNLHRQAKNGLKTSYLGGDFLVILRVEKGDLTVQVIDGEQVQSPFLNDKFHKEAKARGNTINRGIEKDEKGKHVAYYVRTQTQNSVLDKFIRVEAYGKNTGRKLAYMVYFDKHRIDHDRGIGSLSAILEKVEKLDRYTEATVGSAEERAKLPYFFEHDRNSTGENPMAGKLAKALGNKETKIVDSYSEGEIKAKEVARTTSKMVFNLPEGVSINTPNTGSSEINYPEFWKAVFQSIAAAVDIPPEVALQVYNSNYSASRAAINAFQHSINVKRKEFADDFYQPIYELWLELEVLKSKVTAPGYLQAIRQKNWLGLEAYANARFSGNNMPHIDPKKEIDAIRTMLGDDLRNVPLINLEQAAEKANAGDWNENYKKHLKEKNNIKPADVTDKGQNRE